MALVRLWAAGLTIGASATNKFVIDGAVLGILIRCQGRLWVRSLVAKKRDKVARKLVAAIANRLILRIIP